MQVAVLINKDSASLIRVADTFQRSPGPGNGGVRLSVTTPGNPVPVEGAGRFWYLRAAGLNSVRCDALIDIADRLGQRHRSLVAWLMTKEDVKWVCR